MICAVKFCQKCGVETERYSTGGCKPCVIATAAAYRLSNPERVKASHAAYAKAKSTLQVIVTPEQKAKVKRLGGVRWIRWAINNAFDLKP